MHKAKCAVGIDFNLNMIRQSVKNEILYGSFIPINGNTSRLPFKNDSFDCVVSMLGMGGVFDAKEAFAEMIRVVKNRGGIVSIEMCSPKNVWLRLIHGEIVERLVAKYWGFRDVEIEPLLKTFGITEYDLKYRNDLILGSVYHLIARIRK